MAADKSLKDLSSAVFKIAEDSPKIQKDVKDIRDAICGTEGILESLYVIRKKMENDRKKDAISRIKGNTSDLKISDRRHKDILKGTNSITNILGKIYFQMGKMSKQIDKNSRGNIGSADTRRIRRTPDKDINKKSKSLENMSRSIEIIERLKNLKLKDFIFAGKKMKKINKITDMSRNMFRNFKNAKEAEATINFVNASIDIVKRLSKIWILAKPAQGGAKVIEKIFLGGKRRGGLLHVFRKVNQNSRTIIKGAATLQVMAKSVGSMFIATLALAGMAVVGIPAMLGALLMKGVVWLLIGTFKLLSKSAKTVLKGSLVMLLMSASIIAFGLGLLTMSKAVKDMKLKDVGIMLASIVGVGLAVAGIGLLAVPIAIGSAVLLLMGVSLGLFALSIMAWRNLDAKTAMGNIKEAVGGLREVFGLELGKGDENKSFVGRLAGGIMDIAMAILNFGKSLFIMGTILLAGAALGMLYLGIKPWTNFDAKPAVKNIKLAVGALKEVFGLEEPKGIGGKIGGLVGGALDLAVTILSAGKALITMGTIMLATAMSDLILVTLKPWAKFDPTKAMENMGTAINGLKDIFGLNKKSGGILGSIGGMIGGLFEIGSTLMQSGKALITMGTIAMATGMAEKIAKSLKIWDNYDPSKAMENMGTAVNGLKSLFGLDQKPKGGVFKGFFGGLLEMGTTMIQSGTELRKMGTITTAVGMAEKIAESLKVWDNYNPSKAMDNLSTAINTLKELFGLEDKEESGDTSWWGKLKAKQNAMFELGMTMMQSRGELRKMGTITSAVGMAEKIAESLKVWDDYNPTKAITNMSSAINPLKELFGLEDKKESEDTSWWGQLKAKQNAMFELGMTMMQSASELRKMGAIAAATGMAEKIATSLKVWDDYDPSTAIKHMSDAVKTLKKTFGLEDNSNSSDLSWWEQYKAGRTAMFELGMTMMQSRGELRKMGTIASAVGMAEKIATALHAWDNYSDVNTPIKNMDAAITKLKNVFGLDDKDYDAFGVEAWMDKRQNMLELGVTMMQSRTQLKKMGTIASAVGMAELIATALHAWDNYSNTGNAIKNLESAITQLEDIFGLTGKSNVEPVNTFIPGIDSWYNAYRQQRASILELGITMMQSKTQQAKMTAITSAVGMAELIAVSLHTWDNYDPGKAVKNIDTAVKSLIETFGLDGSKQKSGDSTWLSRLKEMNESNLDVGIAMMQGDKALYQMGTILTASTLMEDIKERLLSWEDFNPSNAVGNIKAAFTGLIDAFELDNEQEDNAQKGALSRIAGFFGDVIDTVTAPAKVIGRLFNTAGALNEAGSKFAKLSSLISGAAAMSTIRESIEPWDSKNATQAINNIKGIVTPITTSVDSINSLNMEKASTMIDVFKSFSKIGIKPFDKFTMAVEKFSASCSEMIDAMDKFEMNSIPASGTSTMSGEEGTPATAVSGNVSINNTKAIAKAIADALQKMPLNAEVNMSDIRLVVNNESGRRVVLTLEN